MARFAATDANDDGNPENRTATLVGYEYQDEDKDGIKEWESFLAARYTALDENSNGVVEKVSAAAVFLHVEDGDDDGTADLRAWVVVKYTAEDYDEDGAWDYEDLVIWKHLETLP